METLEFINKKLKKVGYVFSEEASMEKLEEFKDHRRLTVFYNKGLKCAHPECKKVGTRLIKGLGPGGTVHWDIYTQDLEMMTVDHIHPKSKGGGEELENKQPMCRSHNTKKGNKVPPLTLQQKVTTQNSPTAVPV